MPKRIFGEFEATIEVCPFAYLECNLPKDTLCPVQAKLQTLSLDTYFKYVEEKTLVCAHQGGKLTHAQYRCRKVGKLI